MTAVPFRGPTVRSRNRVRPVTDFAPASVRLRSGQARPTVMRATCPHTGTKAQDVFGRKPRSFRLSQIEWNFKGCNSSFNASTDQWARYPISQTASNGGWIDDPRSEERRVGKE